MCKTIIPATVIFALILSACSVGISNANLSSQLTPYQTSTSVPTDTSSLIISTPLALPTPTPNYHIVIEGETMSGIALQYGVKTADIQAANANVNPNAMSVGTRLLIPSSSGAGLGGYMSTPVPVVTGPLVCNRTRDGGAYCFLTVMNNQSTPVENIIAHIYLGNAQSGQMQDQLTSSPLDVLPPTKAMPLTAYFPPPLPDVFQTSFQMVSAIPVSDGTARYLDASVENVSRTITPNGLSTTVSGEVVLKDANTKASRVWVVCIAKDEGSQIVGVRRWEGTSTLSGGQRLPFSLQVYSFGSAIAFLDLLVEVRR